MAKSVESSELGRDGMAASQRQGLAKISSAYVIFRQRTLTRRDATRSTTSKDNVSRFMLAYLALEPPKMRPWISGMRDPYMRRSDRVIDLDGELKAGRHSCFEWRKPVVFAVLSEAYMGHLPCSLRLLSSFFSFRPHDSGGCALE
jgi:hypothetical protein